MSKKVPLSYSRAQIWLHWVVVIGILGQIAIHEPIVRMMSAVRAGETPVPDDVMLANIHMLTGTIILVAILIRLWLRVRHGVPAHAPGVSSMQTKLASLVHSVFYVLLIAMAITGMLTSNEVINLGKVHFIIFVTIFFLALGHAGIALHSQFIRKDGTLGRMNPFKKSGG